LTDIKGRAPDERSQDVPSPAGGWHMKGDSEEAQRLSQLRKPSKGAALEPAEGASIPLPFLLRRAGIFRPRL